MKENPGTLHVLLADDDSDDSLLFSEALEQSPVSTRFSRAEDGNELLKFLHTQEKPDILFLDVNMPCKNGLECLQEIRSKTEFEDLPIIIYSTTNYQVNIDACYQGGADLYVVKPSSFEGILKMVKEVCSNDWLRRQKRSPEFFLLDTSE